jgi:ATP-dependent DNA helicase RecG
MISVEILTKEQADRVTKTSEGQYSEVKGVLITPANLTKTISAFADTDGGELFVGINETSFPEKKRSWWGFSDQEAASGHLQIFEKLFPLGTDFQYEFLQAPDHPGLVLHILVNRTKGIVPASNTIAYIRRGAQNLPCDTPEAYKRLEYAKGVASFENELTNAAKEIILTSEVIKDFIDSVIPSAEPEAWLKKQTLLRDDKPTVAGVLLFSDEPQAVLPKHCGIKVYRYKTKEAAGFREVMDFTPRTVEGCLYDQIQAAVDLTREVAETIPKMGAGALESIQYPTETLHEIITNAVIHRDYSITDDVHIRIFDNRIEVQSPGRLPAHVTVEKILDERFARNGAIVRLLNKFRNPPNKDVGEGLNTAFRAMTKLGLKEPVITELENSLLVIIKHESLASPEETIMDYLETHPTIRNEEARAITYITADHKIKTIFGRMVENGMLEQVPGTRTRNTAYRKVMKEILPEAGKLF